MSTPDEPERPLILGTFASNLEFLQAVMDPDLPPALLSRAALLLGTAIVVYFDVHPAWETTYHFLTTDRLVGVRIRPPHVAPLTTITSSTFSLPAPPPEITYHVQALRLQDLRRVSAEEDTTTLYFDLPEKLASSPGLGPLVSLGHTHPLTPEALDVLFA